MITKSLTAFFISMSLLVVMAIAGCADSHGTDVVSEGDLIFQNLGDEGISGAINEVSVTRSDIAPQDDKRSFSHCGMVINVGDSLAVIEAIDDSVQVTPLSVFMARNEGQSSVTIKRLKTEYCQYIPEAKMYMLSQRGLAYDEEYLLNNGKWYCSELVTEAFNHAVKMTDSDDTLFTYHPMTFKNQDTGEFPQEWVEHYKSLGVPIPEGSLGNNPNDIFNAEVYSRVKEKK